ncbi:hypothetical protein [Gimesia sp.]|uniref:hypothetical protein n=1 Tax=Gimesia sp. TaxID=2024833 RepID=UPI003A957F27
MSKVNEIQDGIDYEFASVMKWMLTIVSAIITAGIGVVLGAIVGIYGLLYFCLFMGDGFAQAGWVLAYITVPVGILGGAILGGSLPFFFHIKWK